MPFLGDIRFLYSHSIPARIFPNTSQILIEMMCIEERIHTRIVGARNGSLIICIPFPIALLLHVKKGDKIKIQLVDGKIVMEKTENGTKEEKTGE